MIGRLSPSASATRAESPSAVAEGGLELPQLVSESSASRAGYTRRFRLAGPASQAYLQEVETEVEFCVRQGAERFCLVRYVGRYQELLFGGGLDRHSLEVWREGWDQRGLRALLGRRLSDPRPALELLRHGDPELVALKRFRLAAAEADCNQAPGYLPGALPAQLTLYHPRQPLTLEPQPYPQGCQRQAQVVRAGLWAAEASERFVYDFATCAAELTTTPYRTLPEVNHG